MTNMDEIATYERDLANMESRIESVFADADVEAELPQADLDMLDVCFSMASGLVGVFVATNDDVAKWLEKVHDAASGNPGDCGVVQQMLGSLLFHKGDALDVYAPEEGFIARNGERTYVMFHRLLFGHDVLATGRGLMPYNPFELMYQQKGLMGIVQAVRHLLADTMSKQGLPVPGSSHLDTEREGGGPWNRIIDWVQGLSIEAGGDKKMAQEIYSHMFTIRAQDIAAGGLVAFLVGCYAKSRAIEDPVRKAQIELVGTGVAFFGQAALGAVRQKGVPYINNAMAPQLVKAYGGLLAASAKRTKRLEERTEKLCTAADRQIMRHDRISEEVAAIVQTPVSDDEASASISSLIGYLEGR